MTAALDREGIFKAKAVKWAVRKAESGAVSVNMQFLILAQLDGDEWNSWEQVQDHFCYGDFYVIKKDGKINGTAVEQLVAALGWDGDLRSVVGEAPNVVVQITVKADEYKGVTRYKASWINPEDFTPGAFGESDEDVKQLQARYGSLLRAAAAGAAGAKPATKAAPAAAPKPKAPPPAAKPMPAAVNGSEPLPGSADGDLPPGDEIPF